MTIHNLIIHNIVKKQFVKGIETINSRKTELKINKKETIFLEKLLNVYYNKSNPSYGVFDENASMYPLQNTINDFLDKKITLSNKVLSRWSFLKKRLKMKLRQQVVILW